MTRVKICGITNVTDALCALEAGADMIGFVFAAGRRQVSPDLCAEILTACRRQLPPRRGKWTSIGVFAGQPLADVLRAVDSCKLDGVQLSGEEPPEYCRQIRLPLFKAVHLPAMQAAGGAADLSETLSEIRRASGADRLLLDSGGQGHWGGTGTAFNWHLAGRLAADCIVAGGLSPSNVGAAIFVMRPWAVDVSTGVESAGRKDPALIRSFIAQVRRNDSHGTS